MASHIWGNARQSDSEAADRAATPSARRHSGVLARLGPCTTALLLTAQLAGCGNTMWAMRANGASNKLEEAREVGAEDLAPYEFWMAVEHLKKAREEAADADYSDAIDLASESEEFAEKAIRLTRDAHRGAGR